jgi:hypothetical protein
MDGRIVVGCIVRGLSFFVALALFAQAPSGVFEIELWPDEGRPRFQVDTNDLAVRVSPSSSARIVHRLRGSRGHNIAFDQTRYRTTESGRLQVLATSTVSGRVLGPIHSLTRDAYYKGQFPEHVVACQKGDVIEFLQHRAEGTCFVRVADQVIDADPCPVGDNRAFRLMTEPKIEWWIRVILDRVPVGWVIVDEKTVKQNGRSF